MAACLLGIGTTLALTGCQTEYRGHDSGIDGTLARQIALFKDPLSRQVYSPPGVNEPTAYLDGLPGAWWDGSTESVDALGIGVGGVVLYDLSETDDAVAFSVFIGSGPRPNVPTDAGGSYSGPSEVFTCYRIEAEFGTPSGPSVSRAAIDGCPEALVELLTDDAAFASAEVFDG